MRFLKTEVASGVILLGAAVVSIAMANSSLADLQSSVLATQLGPLTSLEWINDVLMAFFFFVVGLEIKAEWVDGELSSRKRALLPIAGALGGMIVPALLYLCFARDRGWGVPMATDIAFAVGVLSLFRVSASLRTFLLALAIVDDLGASVVVAIFYSGKIHLTIVGCILGLFVKRPRPWLSRLHPWSAFLVMPLFALANAGVHLENFFTLDGVANGVSVGLLVGKPVGILFACWIAVRAGFAQMNFSYRELIGVACLGGIGFTMSLFIAQLAYADASVLEIAKLGVIRGSLLSALTGVLVMTLVNRPSDRGVVRPSTK